MPYTDPTAGAEGEVVLKLKGFHRAMPEEQLKQLNLRDEQFAVPLIKEILTQLEEGFEKYTFDPINRHEPNAPVNIDSAAHQDWLSEYERIINRFNDVSAMMVGYRISWGMVERISNVIYPLVCSSVMARRTTSLWMTLVNRLTSIYCTKKAHIVPPFTIRWRPLCDLVTDLIGEPCLQVECPSSGRDSTLFSKDTLNTLVEGCCRYFDDEAFGEVWSYLKPRLQRRNGEFYLGLFCGLLPVHRCSATPQQREVAKEVLDTLFDWSEDRFNFLFGFGFQTCDILYYIASKENVGRFDLTPYAERIFTLNLRMSSLRSDFATTTHAGFGIPQFNVGVGSAAFFSPESLGDFKNTSIASAIAYALPNDRANVLWSQLKRFLRACETYTCSSSASTRQSQAVAEWIWRFTSCFIDRVRDQQLGTFPIPDGYVLSQETIDVFVGLMQKHVIERLYRTTGNATEVIRLVALSPRTMLPYLQKLIVQGASSGNQTSFPQVALGVIGLIANQASYEEDPEMKEAMRALVHSQRDWVVECLEDTNGPNFMAGAGTLAGLLSLLPMDALYEDEASVSMRITKALFKLISHGGRDEHIATISVMLLFMYRACNPSTLDEISRYIVGEVRTKATPASAERIFLSALSTYAPDSIVPLYFPVAEEILNNPRSTLQEKKTHMEFFGTLALGSIDLTMAYAPRVLGMIKKVLVHITSTDMVVLTGRLLHCAINALMLPRTDARSDREADLDSAGMYRAFGGRDVKVKWILPTDESKMMAVDIYVELATWAMGHLEDVAAAVPKLKADRDALGIPLSDHEEEFNVNSVRRGLVRFLQLCVGDAGRLLLTAASAYGVLNERAAEVKSDSAKVLRQMMSAMHSTSFVFPAGIPGAFDTTPEVMQVVMEKLRKVDTLALTDVFVKASADSEAADDAISTQVALTGIHMLHGISFSSGNNLREIIKAFQGDPAGLTRRRPMLYYIGAASAAAYDVSAYMCRDEVVGESRTRFFNAIEYYTNSPFVKVAKEAQDVLMLHIRHMSVAECLPFIEEICKKNADFISAPNDITSNAIAEKNLINSMVVASNLCSAATPSAIRTLIAPFVEGTVQLKCRPTVEATLEKILGGLLNKLSRAVACTESDWLLDVISKVMHHSFIMTPQKKLMFLDQISVLRLRRTDASFVGRLVNLAMEIMPLFHCRDQTLVMGTQRALTNITHGLFRAKYVKTVRLGEEDARSSSSSRGPREVVEVITSEEEFKKALLRATQLRTLGTIVLPKEFCVYAPMKKVLVEVADSAAAAAAEGDNANMSSVSSAAGVSTHRWSASRWREWFTSVLRRLTVGDCGASFRTLTMFTSRMILLSNYATVGPILDACRTVFDDYKAQTDTTRKRESGAVVCAFSICRTIEELMRVELYRVEGGEMCLSEYPTPSPAAGASASASVPPSATTAAFDKVAFAAMLKSHIESYQTLAEEVMLFACESSTITTETFFEFASVSPIDSDALKSRLIRKLAARITHEEEGAVVVVAAGTNSPPPPTISLSSPLGGPLAHAHSSSKCLFRYFCFLVALSSTSSYEGYSVLETNNISMTFLEKHMGHIIAESSRSSAIAQQLIDQIGHYISRNLHFAFTWDSELWEFTRGLTGRAEGMLRGLLARSMASMEASAKAAGPLPPPASGADSSASEQPLSVLSPTEGGPAAGGASTSEEEQITIRAGDTTKFEVLLIVRILSLTMSQFVQRLMPEVIAWLTAAQRWVSDDTALADRLLSLARNIVSRDVNKATVQSTVTQLCDLLLEVSARAAAGGADGDADADGEGDDHDGGGDDENDTANHNLLSPPLRTPPPDLLSPVPVGDGGGGSSASNVLSPPAVTIPPCSMVVGGRRVAPFSPLTPMGGGGPAGDHGAGGGFAAANKPRNTYSSTRRVVLMLTASLSRMLFLNLHRIGKFAMLQRCSDAMSASLGSLSHTSKSDHKTVAKNAIAVLVRVSSDDQITALVNPQLEVLKRAQGAEGGLVGIARSDIDQLRAVKKAVHFLCAVVLAYPEQVPPFCGKILKALAPYGTAPVAEVKNAVSAMFKVWWRTHRERWEYEFKDQFTPAQQSVVLEYWSSSSYYA